MDLGLRDRTYLVTGGSRGLGWATAEVLVEEGASVVLSARSAEGVHQAAGRLGSSRAVGVVADNADPAVGERLVAAAVAKFGRIDGALVSVGGPPPGSALETKDADWEAAFASIFLGALRITRAVAAAARDDGGASIAYVLSTAAKSPIDGLAISNGLRPGLAMLTKQLADELGPAGIRVNGLLPGRIDTARTRELDAKAGDPEAFRARLRAAIPLRRIGTTREFGTVAAFVLSPAASYVTGALIPVDGGTLRAL